MTMERRDVRALSPLALAFMGDAVYETLVREKIVEKGSAGAASLHREAVKMVRASFQSAAVDWLLPVLTEEETDIFKRGRNATGNSVPRSSNPRDYRRATGLEALFGYLHLLGMEERIAELFGVILENK